MFFSESNTNAQLSTTRENMVVLHKAGKHFLCLLRPLASWHNARLQWVHRRKVSGYSGE